jgi:membrane-associated phospholipid phosphatase
MKKNLRLFITAILFIPIVGFTQQKDTLIKKLDSLSRKKDSAGGQVNIINPKAYTETTQLTFNSYFILLASDLKQEFTKPFHMTPRDWRNFGKFAVVTVALGFADEPIQHFAAHLRSKDTTFQKVSEFITRFGGTYETYALITLGAYGFIFKDKKIKAVTFLATQAYITGAALEKVLKFVTGRTRPSFYAANTEAEPRFLGPFSGKKGPDGKSLDIQGSFPSGHTTVAFAAATVFAMEYRNRPIVPVIAYTSATIIGLSRITENKHWATDVLAGAAVGYLAGQNIVNNYHRYAKLKASSQKKNTLAFNLQYLSGQLVP